MEQNERRPLLGGFETLLLVLGIGVVAYIFLKQRGITFMEKTERVKIVDKPMDRSESPKTVSYDQDQNMTDLEQILQELTGVSQTNAKLSQSDIDFYQKIKANYKKNPEVHSIEWMKYLSSSYSIYNEVQSFFSSEETSKGEWMASDFKKVLENPKMADKLLNGLQKMYDISANETKSFFTKEKQVDAVKLVEFIEKKKRK